MRFFLALLLFGCTATRERPPVAAGCPDRRAAVTPNTSCALEPYQRCDYEGASWCVCAPRSCVSPAGPIPNCVSVLRWSCRDDGCPQVANGACSEEGKHCEYDDGMCSWSSDCVAGQWKAKQRICRP